MSRTQKLAITSKVETASNVFFVLGFAVSRLCYTPFILLAFWWSNVGSLFFNTIAYALWMISGYMHPDSPAQEDKWYGFTGFKNQTQLAALLGIVATFSFALALTMPSAAILANWLFAASDIMWCIGEYHKKNLPPQDADYSHSKQKVFFRYALLASEVACLNAINVSIIIFFPEATLFIATLWGVATIALGIQSTYFLVDFVQKARDSAPDTPMSYELFYNYLFSPQLEPGLENNLSPPAHHPSPLAAPAKPLLSMPLNNDNNTVLSL